MSGESYTTARLLDADAAAVEVLDTKSIGKIVFDMTQERVAMIQEQKLILPPTEQMPASAEGEDDDLAGIPEEEDILSEAEVVGAAE